MSENDIGPPVGSIAWIDLTVENAETIRDFYRAVAGWEASGEDMGGYEDFTMSPAGSSDGIAGICHARGVNADMPAQWLIYITVADVEAAAAETEKLGGRVVVGPRPMGSRRFCVVQDPAGAVAALIEP